MISGARLARVVAGVQVLPLRTHRRRRWCRMHTGTGARGACWGGGAAGARSLRRSAAWAVVVGRTLGARGGAARQVVPGLTSGHSTLSTVRVRRAATRRHLSRRARGAPKAALVRLVIRGAPVLPWVGAHRSVGTRHAVRRGLGGQLHTAVPVLLLQLVALTDGALSKGHTIRALPRRVNQRPGPRPDGRTGVSQDAPSAGAVVRPAPIGRRHAVQVVLFVERRRRVVASERHTTRPPLLHTPEQPRGSAGHGNHD